MISRGYKAMQINQCDNCVYSKINPFWHPYLMKCDKEIFGKKVLKPCNNSQNNCKYYTPREDTWLK